MLGTELLNRRVTIIGTNDVRTWSTHKLLLAVPISGRHCPLCDYGSDVFDVQHCYFLVSTSYATTRSVCPK